MVHSDVLKGLAIGVGVAVVAPVVVTSVLGASRPLARAALKSGMILFEKGREAVAEFTEVVEDLVAEARAEIEQAHAQPTGAAVVAGPAQKAGEAEG